MTLRDDLAPHHVRTNRSQVHFEGPIFTIRNDSVTFESGDTVWRQYMEHDDAVAIVALRQSAEGWEILLIRQYRHPLRKLMWEIPAGLIDIAGEDELTTAKRELAEEARLAADDWTYLVSLAASPGCSTEDLTVFLAKEPYPVDYAFEREAEEAEIVTQWVPLAEVTDAVLRGDLHSPTLVAGVLAVNVVLNRAHAGMNKLAHGTPLCF